MTRKMVLIDEKIHRKLWVVAARKGSNLKIEANAAIEKYADTESRKLDRSEAKEKGAA